VYCATVKHLALAAPISSLGLAAGGLLQVGTIGYRSLLLASIWNSCLSYPHGITCDSCVDLKGSGPSHYSAGSAIPFTRFIFTRCINVLLNAGKSAHVVRGVAASLDCFMASRSSSNEDFVSTRLNCAR
jgi:hypothetical protein